MLLERRRLGLCLNCGSPEHFQNACPEERKPNQTPPSQRNRARDERSAGREGYRPPPRQKVTFNVSMLRGEYPGDGVGILSRSRDREEPRTSGREGDVLDDDEAVVEAYMAARALRSSQQSSRGGFGEALDYE